MPLFAAREIALDGAPVGVVRVYQSADTPHVSNGSVYVREQGAKATVTDRATLMELARRGSDAENDARARLSGSLDPIRSALVVPPRRDTVNREEIS